MLTVTLRSGSRAILVNARLSDNTESPALTVAKVLPGRENFIKHAAEVPDHGSGPRMMEAAFNALQPSRAAVDAGHHHVLTARDSAGKLAGAIRYSHEPGGFDEIPQDHVHIHFLGSTGETKGVGTHLLLHALAHARDKGTGVGLSSLPAAEPFYGKMGLEHSGHDMYGLSQYTASNARVNKILDERGPNIRSPHE